MNAILSKAALTVTLLFMPAWAFAEDQMKGTICRLSASADNYEIVIEYFEKTAFGNNVPRFQSLAELAFRKRYVIGFLVEKDRLTLLSYPRDLKSEKVELAPASKHMNVTVVGLVALPDHTDVLVRLETEEGPRRVKVLEPQIQRLLENAFEFQRPLVTLVVNNEGQATMANTAEIPAAK